MAVSFVPEEESEQTPDVAIVGMVGSFPGATSVGELWDLLRTGREGLTHFTEEELLAHGRKSDLVADPRYVRSHGVIPDVDLFDTAFFEFTPAEAEIIDPQQRLFLQHCHAALEDAGYDPSRFPGLISVYAGAAINTYLQNNVLPNVDQTTTSNHFAVMVGNDKDYLATRVAYKLDLKGAGYTVQTACSTSLVAIHLACQGLVNGECDMALAGGVTVKLPQEKGYLYEEGAILSKDGHVRVFDAGASGTVLGNGVGVVVLKLLRDALADGDTVHAVIKGTATNNDGSLKVSYAAPGKDGQAAVIAEAHAVSGIDPETIGYVEAHGTGTRLGDPVEVSALSQAFRGATDRKGFCGIGSVKSNLGHLDAAAGVTGVIKTALMLRHKALAPTINFDRPNPEIDFANSPFRVVDEFRPWESDGIPRRAGVSSFGIGGTNAHAILEEAPEGVAVDPGAPEQVLVLSAKTATALDAMTRNMAGHLRAHPGLSVADVAFTLAVGRQQYPHRRAVLSHGGAGAAAEALEAALQNNSGAAGNSAPKPVRTAIPLHFVFREELADAEALAAEICAREEPFKRYYQAARRAGAGKRGAAGTGFAVQYALGRVWLERGLVPAVAYGQGSGGVAAACVAGSLTLKDAMALLDQGRGAVDAFVQGPQEGRPEGRRRPRFTVKSLAAQGRSAADGAAVVLEASAEAPLETVRRVWLAGGTVDWSGHFADQRRRRISLPTYPFEGRRVWMDEPVRAAGSAEGTSAPAVGAVAGGLHPLVDANVSSLFEQRYVARRDGGEFYLAD
ncbi:type I polyketide synthase, partial [Streptomyces noursei]